MDVSIPTTIKVTKSSETGVPISCHVMELERRTLMTRAYAYSRPGDRPELVPQEILGDGSVGKSSAVVTLA